MKVTPDQIQLPDGWEEDYQPALGGACAAKNVLAWIANHPIAPTEIQVVEVSKAFRRTTSESLIEWQRIAFLKPFTVRPILMRQVDAKKLTQEAAEQIERDLQQERK